MAKKRKTLPKDFQELIEAGNIEALKAVFDTCELDARGGYSKGSAISFSQVPDELIRWLVEQGADVNAADRHGDTPLHSHARSWCGNVDLLLELGADIEALNQSDCTPLHMAAVGHRPKAVRSLIEHGANIHAKNKFWHRDPFMEALVTCQNVSIEPMAEIAEIFLAAGAEITPEMRTEVKRIGKDFEFHRENFNKDSLEATDAALLRLYELFGVTPVPKRRIHDGVSKITVTATDWRKQHAELWDYLVPSKGCAKTVQGEAIRVVGRLSYEIMDNGGCNWDDDFRAMLDALTKYLAMGTPLESAALLEVKKLAAKLRSGTGDDESMRLTELAVSWVLANPDPIPLGKPDYKR